jgi:hypothetical protein
VFAKVKQQFVPVYLALLRYLDAIAPGMTLLQLLSGDDPAIIAMERRSRPQRVRDLSTAEMKALDF